MKLCCRHVKYSAHACLSSILKLHLVSLLLFAIQEKNASEKKFLIKSHFKETNLYEKPVVAYADEILRVKELVVAVIIGRFCFRFGANGWLRPFANWIWSFH
jgi:hypothetical protein